MNKKLAVFGAFLFSFSFLVSAEIDLKEANVMGVERNGHQFSVTLYHDDDGEEGYANWWQIETLDGEKIVRRDLSHSHGTQNFTRSEIAKIHENTSEIVVRGHDQTHKYGGRAIIYNLTNGDKRIVDQGSEPQNFTTNTLDNHEEDSNVSEHNDSHNHDHSHGKAGKEDQKGFIKTILNLVSSFF